MRKLDYSLHVNAKKAEAPCNHPDREQQFDYIAVQRAAFTAAGLPILSVDTGNPIEHGLFSQISCNRAGHSERGTPSWRSFEVPGPRLAWFVQAMFNTGEYPTGQKASGAEMAALHMLHHPSCPKWNYTIGPRSPT